MTRAILARATLVVLGVAAIAWYAHGLRAMGLREDGEATVRSLGARPDPAALRSAGDDFAKAARFNADPAPELDEAVLLLRTGRAREAARGLTGVVRDNPGSVRGLALLAAATSTFDERRSAAVNGRLLELYGRQQGLTVLSGFVVAPDGRRFRRTATGVKGNVESARTAGAVAVFRGWAASLTARRRAELVLVVSHGRVVAATVPFVPRPDVARQFGPTFSRAGFAVRVPLSRLRRGGALDVHLFAAQGGVASLLPVRCQPVKQLGC